MKALTTAAGGTTRPGGEDLAADTTSDGGEICKPLPGYFGSKDAAGVAEKIIAGFPPHSRYIEPFLGGGATLRRKVPALRSIGIDQDPRVIAAWRATRYAGLELVEGCGIAWLERHGEELPADALVYIDPPYLPETRTSRKRYRFELTPGQHDRLLTAARRLPCSVAVSHYWHALYAEAFQDWEHESFPAMTRGGLRTEHLWRRSTIASFGGGAQFAGRDYRERERIKKLVTRWRRRFVAMPAAERRAVLAALLEGERSCSTAAAGGDGQPSSTAGDGGGGSPPLYVGA